MAKVTVLVCDKCGEQGEVESFEIRHGSKRANVDLCAKDAVAVHEVMALTRMTTQRQSGRARSSSQPRRVMSMEEIEQLKQS